MPNRNTRDDQVIVAAGNCLGVSQPSPPHGLHLTPSRRRNHRCRRTVCHVSVLLHSVVTSTLSAVVAGGVSSTASGSETALTEEAIGGEKQRRRSELCANVDQIPLRSARRRPSVEYSTDDSPKRLVSARVIAADPSSETAGSSVAPSSTENHKSSNESNSQQPSESQQQQESSSTSSVAAVSLPPVKSVRPPQHPQQQQVAQEIILDIQTQQKPQDPQTIPRPTSQQSPKTEDVVAAVNLKTKEPPVLPSEEKRKILVRSIHSDGAGLFSMSGRKHHRLDTRNEDAGSYGDYFVLDVETNKTFRTRMAWIFDGHGPESLNRIPSPGRLVAKTAIKAHQYATAASLARILSAPILPANHPDYLTKSRQAIFSNTFNETQNAVEQLLPPVVHKFAGATATAILSIGEQSLNGGDVGPIDLMCSNLGDSRALAITFTRDPLPPQIRFKTPLPYRITPENVYTLTAEENIRQQPEKQWFIQECFKNGYRPAAIHPHALSRRRPLSVVMVPSKPSAFDIRMFEPFTTLEDIHVALQHAREVLHPNENYSVYVLKDPYLWRIDARGKRKCTGLQLTGSIGDSHLKLVKRMKRTANDVSVIRLNPDQKRTTLVVSASDGLWDAVEKLPNKASSFALWIADRLNEYGHLKDVNQRLSEDLTRWATSTERDDVTISILSYPSMTVTNTEEPISNNIPPPSTSSTPPVVNQRPKSSNPRSHSPVPQQPTIQPESHSPQLQRPMPNNLNVTKTPQALPLPSLPKPANPIITQPLTPPTT